jgi:hypothetical protein
MAKQQLPKAVRKQIQAGNKAAKEAGLMTDDGEHIIPGSIQAEATPENDAPAPDAEANKDASAEDISLHTPTPSADVAAPSGAESNSDSPPKDPAPAAQPTSDEDSFEHKYKVLQNKYSKEVPRYAQEVRELNSTIQRQTADIENLRAVLSGMRKPAGENETHAPSPVGDLTQDDIDEYGEDLIQVIQKTARGLVGDQLAALQQENAQLRNQVGQVASHVARSVEGDMYAELAKAVPDWQEINTDDAFLSWLGQADPYSGYTRHQMLRDAFTQKNTGRVIAFFTGYLNENTMLNQPHSEAAPAPDTKATGKPALEDLAAPGKAQRATSGAQEEVQVWTQPEISEFYADVRRGKFSADPALQRKIEKSIFKAQETGNIR